MVTTAPFLTAMLVIAADRGGTVRESIAISRAYAGAREQPSGELLQAILSTPPAIDPATAPRTPQDVRSEAPATLRQAVGILERHATQDELIAYKSFVFSLADTVARAHREGGFLGIGGTEISDHEQDALDEIAAIFDEHRAPDPAGGAGATTAQRGDTEPTFRSVLARAASPGHANRVPTSNEPSRQAPGCGCGSHRHHLGLSSSAGIAIRTAG